MNDFALPPHSIEAEQSVLGALLQQPDAFDGIAGRVDAGMFYRAQHGTVFRVIADMMNANQPVDFVTVAERLEQVGALDDLGGMAYLAELHSSTPSARNIGRYAAIVREKWQARRLMAIGHEITDAATTMQVHDAVSQAQEKLSSVVESTSRGEAQPIGVSVAQVLEHIDTAFNNKTGIVGLSTGLIDLDGKLGGLRPGQLIIVAGRPGMGKTAMALQIAHEIASTGTPTLVLSMEMPAIELAAREVARVAKLSVADMMRGKLHSDDDWAALTHGMSRVKELPMLVDEQGGLSFVEAAAKIRLARRKHSIGLAVLDYLQLMHGDGDNRNQELEGITRGLKALSKELGIPIIALSQLSRKCEERTNKRPMLSDLRESGGIEQDADVVLMIYRDEVYNQDSEDKGTAEIIIAKQRQGPTGRIRTVFHGEYASFADFAGEQFPHREAPKKGRGL